MEECKCGRRLSDPLDPPSEETMQRACDVLEHHLKTFRELNRASKLPIEITEEHIKIINRFMEEKKTKKMTKAEAFEWLNNKKLTAKDDVYANVLFKLFECGIEWVLGGQSFTYYGSDFLIIEGGKLFHCGNDGEGYWRAHHFEEVSVEDILSIEIIDDEKKSKEEDELDEINLLGSQICEILRHMKGHHHVAITETDVILYDEGMSLFHSDPF